MIEHFVIPTSGRQARRLDDACARAAEELGDRTVWWWPAAGDPEDAVGADDVVHNDRDETVGGTRHARPVVAAR
jgi:hypothetical protein